MDYHAIHGHDVASFDPPPSSRESIKPNPDPAMGDSE